MVRERVDRNGGTAPVPPSASLSVAELRQLIALMEHSDIEEMTIEHEGDGMHLTLRKPAPVALDPSAALAAGIPLEAVSDPVPETGAEDDSATTLDVRSMLVGLYRSVAKRGAKPVAPGDTVKEGQIIGAVEALNVLNEIESPATGRVKKILVDDGQPVEYGQVLMMVEPRDA